VGVTRLFIISLSIGHIFSAVEKQQIFAKDAVSGNLSPLAIT